MGAAIGRACNLDSAEDADEGAPLSPCQRLSLQVFFLEALYDNLEGKLKSIFEVDRTQWLQLYAAIQRLGASSEANDSDAISSAIERYFIPLVQDDDVLMPALEAYVPAPGRNWEHFLELKQENMNALERKAFREKYVEPGEALENVLERSRDVVRRFLFAIGGLVLGTVEVPEGGGLHADANKKTDGEKIDVFYATDRYRDQSKGEYIEQPCDRADRLHYGHVVVTIPKGHEPGISETPVRSEYLEPNKHVILRSERQFLDDKEHFVKEINASMQEKSGVFREQALLYIHGFSVRHKKAIRNAAQLATDLKFEGGVVIVYSWPSKGSIWYYRNDAAVIEESAHCLHRFITTILCERVKFSKVHMLAHSMGNRALIKALTMYYLSLNPRRLAIGIRELGRWPRNAEGRPQRSSGVQAGAGNVADLPRFTSSTLEAGSSSGVQAKSKFEAGSSSGVQAKSKFEAGSSSGVQAKSELVNIISAAADETRNKYEDMLRAVLYSPEGSGAGNSPRFTIYSSVTDGALMASTVRNLQMRLGDTRSLVQHTRCIFKRILNMHERVDVVDASGLTRNMDTFLHSYYARADNVLSDIGMLLTSLDRAHIRSRNGPHIGEVRYAGRHFFAFDTAWWTDNRVHLLPYNRVQCLSCIHCAYFEVLLRRFCFEYLWVRLPRVFFLSSFSMYHH